MNCRAPRRLHPDHKEVQSLDPNPPLEAGQVAGAVGRSAASAPKKKQGLKTTVTHTAPPTPAAETCSHGASHPGFQWQAVPHSLCSQILSLSKSPTGQMKLLHRPHLAHKPHLSQLL